MPSISDKLLENNGKFECKNCGVTLLDFSKYNFFCGEWLTCWKCWTRYKQELKNEKS